MKITSYHTYHSSGIGGVETLIRSLKELVEKNGGNFNEVYHSTMVGSYFDSIHGMDTKLIGGGLGSNFLGRLIRKITIYFYFLFEPMDEKILILTHPYNLNFLPSKVKRTARIVLIQINRPDVFLNEKNLSAVKRNENYIDAITSYTTKDRESLCKILSSEILSSKVIVIPRGCKLETGGIREFTGNKKLVTIARVEEKQKNFQAMLDIVDKLPNDYTLDIYGEGDKNEVKLLKKRISTQSRINFMGPATDIKKILSKYDVFIMTSHYEGFGQTLIEARSQGMPLVLFNSFDAAPWIIKDNKNGYLVKYGDVQMFCNAIKLLCENKDVYSRMSQFAIYFSKETEMDVVNREWIELLEHLGGKI
ncbi:glycosyltransferase [Aeromonas caviae]|uniref:glycosyltransferase n=1 Tax=Aeromonas caviae TaxID=648 RepID=UPI00244809F5|nr:glycosyltransferase [Aeromonas caviae]MDH0474534.1 glycosyltransferase [Aeromonas caviae]